MILFEDNFITELKRIKKREREGRNEEEKEEEATRAERDFSPRTGRSQPPVRFCGNARYPRKVRGRRTQAREEERGNYFADRVRPSAGETGRSGVRASKRAAVFTRRARASACNARLFVVVRFVPRARRDHSVVADYATRGHESASRSRECSHTRARSLARSYRRAGLAELSISRDVFTTTNQNAQASKRPGFQVSVIIEFNRAADSVTRYENNYYVRYRIFNLIVT